MPKPPLKRRKPTPTEPPDLAGFADADKPDVRASDLQGLRFFKKIRPLLQTLHDVGTQRDKPKNRDLHMDQYGVLVLMWMFNPILTSLRGLQQASTLDSCRRQRIQDGRASGIAGVATR